MFFTVFTPTYNRAHTLTRLYESLKNQTSKDFEWLIVDDGSEDETETLIKKFISENEMPIRYYKQKNQGKHIAINTALKLISTPYFVTVDSDDYVTNNCVGICRNLADKINNLQDYAGFAFIRFSENTPYNPSEYGSKTWTDFQSYNWEFKGEKTFAFKTEIAKQFPFPVYEDEKFCQEAVFILPIMKRYKVLFTDHVLAHGDYLEDGLSQNLYKRLLANPRYAMLSYGEKLRFKGYKANKKPMISSYWDIALKSKHVSWKEKINGIPLSYSLIYLLDKIRKRFK